jgi:hypothetical protein
MEQAAAARSALRFHPAAGIFPLMSEAELSALAEDIRLHGQQAPIVMVDGAILDGRNRWLACGKAEREPWCVEWHGVGTPLDFVVSQNLHRRQLNTSQRALIAAEIANMPEGNHRQGSNRIEISGCPTTAREAGSLLGVSRPLVLRAKTILARGTEQEVDAVRSGKSTVSATAQKIWDRERKTAQPTGLVIQFPQPRRGTSRRHLVKLPDGLSPEEVARKALALREQIGSSQAVAAQLGIRETRCRQMMDIVLIADRTDLSAHDTQVAAAALKAMNEQRVRLAHVYQTISPIMRRLWGDRRGTSRASLEAIRSERFEHGIGILIQACKNGPKIEVPHLSPERARDLLVELKQAIKAVQMLVSRIEGRQ